jgi:peptidyl-tRNA hydrolase
MDPSVYVLSRFRKEEIPLIDQAIKAAASGVELWIKEGISAAMNVVNVSTSGDEDQ